MSDRTRPDHGPISKVSNINRIKRTSDMYPIYDTEGQLEAYKYMAKRLEDDKNSPWGFVTTLVASVLAAALTPAAIWLWFTIEQLSLAS